MGAGEAAIAAGFAVGAGAIAGFTVGAGAIVGFAAGAAGVGGLTATHACVCALSAVPAGHAGEAALATEDTTLAAIANAIDVMSPSASSAPKCFRGRFAGFMGDLFVVAWRICPRECPNLSRRCAGRAGFSDPRAPDAQTATGE
jgi:hypothetical protein